MTETFETHGIIRQNENCLVGNCHFIKVALGGFRTRQLFTNWMKDTILGSAQYRHTNTFLSSINYTILRSLTVNHLQFTRTANAHLPSEECDRPHLKSGCRG